MTTARPLRIAVVAGEESGDLLAADLVSAIGRMEGARPDLIGIGGRHLEALGLASLVDPSSIALMGISAVLRDLPALLLKIRRTARAIVEARPDCLITVDSPDFSLRVARRVHDAAPDIPIIHYVCPSVWAWRPERAPAMRRYVDRILCVLPFETEALERLGGPPGTYVGHRLSRDAGIAEAAGAQRSREPAIGGEKTLLVLPGSRSSEVRSLIGDFGAAVKILAERGHSFRVALPTVPHLEQMVRAETAAWAVRPSVTTTANDKARAFAEADSAIAASGTVTLELALARVPAVSCYKLDRFARMLVGKVTIWSSVLPNIIADRPIYPEHFNEFVRPGMLARHTELLWRDSAQRRAQLEGLDIVAERMATPRPSGEIAAEAVLSEVARRT